MCGRFNLVRPGNLQFRFETNNDLEELEPRYNIAPGQQILIVTNHREMELVRWGLVPQWAKDATFGYRTINARAETILEKPAYRKPIRTQRCLIPATGFYEWQATPGGKVPYHIRLKGGAVFGLAGLYDTWHDPEGTELRTCTIITTSANELMSRIHNRMPVIVRPEDEERWLDPGITDPAEVMDLLRAYPAEEMEAYPVSTLVNSATNDLEAVLDPLPPNLLPLETESD